MTAGRIEDEHPGSPDTEKLDWNWQPSSGEGSASALHKLKRIERVKSALRRLRSGPPKPPGSDGPPSAD